MIVVMRKILVIDDNGQFPEAGLHEHLVETHLQIRDLQTLDPALFTTAFVHTRNTREKEWASEHFDTFFLFTGEVDHPSQHSGVVTLPRHSFKRFFASFLDRYVFDGESITEAGIDVFLNPIIHDVPDPDTESTSSNESSTISFTLSNPNPALKQFQIVHTEGTIDFETTLQPLRLLKNVLSIDIQENYGLTPGDGLQLVLHLRLAAQSEFSRLPIRIKLDSPIEKLIQHAPQNAILCTSGITTYRDAVPPIPIPLTVETHLEVLRSLPITPKDLEGRHDRANEWGVVQLWAGYQSLKPQASRQVEPAWLIQHRRQLTHRVYYRYLLALQYLQDTLHPTSSNPAQQLQHDNAYAEWIAFLESIRSRPLQILAIDDRINDGWKHVLESLFADVPGCASITSGLDHDDTTRIVHRSSLLDTFPG